MPELSFDFTEQEFRDIALKGIPDEMGDEILADIDEAARMWVEENPSRRDNYGPESAPVIEVDFVPVILLGVWLWRRLLSIVKR